MSAPHGPEWSDYGSRRVRDAVRAIRTYAGDDVDRDGADLLLPSWIRFDDLTVEERLSVLDQFPHHVVAGGGS